MEEELISKKELLEETGISYGQLYRWKRKNIIPEDWFIKKSVSTGQETYFPRNKILERIEMIVDMKDEVSLDDLANMFSVEVKEHGMNLEILFKKNVINDTSVQMYKEISGAKDVASMQQVVVIKIIKDKLTSGDLTLQEAQLLVKFIGEHFGKLTGENGKVYIMRYMGVPFVVGAKNEKEIILSDDYKVVVDINLFKEISTIKFEMMA